MFHGNRCGKAREIRRDSHSLMVTLDVAIIEESCLRRTIFNRQIHVQTEDIVSGPITRLLQRNALLLHDNFNSLLRLGLVHVVYPQAIINHLMIQAKSKMIICNSSMQISRVCLLNFSVHSTLMMEPSCSLQERI